MAPRTQAQRAAAAAEPNNGIRCECGGKMGEVLDSRERVGYIWRRRACESCGMRATTKERVHHRSNSGVARETHTTGSAHYM